MLTSDLSTTLHLNLHPFALSSNSASRILVPVTSASLPAYLAPLDTTLIVATRAGELFQYHPSTNVVQPVGDVYDSNPQHSGILAICASPDASLIVIVSPVKALVLDATLELQAELSHRALQHAQITWRADGEYFVVIMTDSAGVLSGVVVDRACEDVKKLDIGDHIVCKPVVAWEPRVGGMIVIAVQGRMLFFERNGLRHLRSDLEIGGNAIQVAWSLDCKRLAVLGEWVDPCVVRIFQRTNYRWYCVRGIRVEGKAVCVVWDEDTVDQLTVFLETGDVIAVSLRCEPSVFALPAGAHAFVIDGESVDVTNFSRALLPPPMNHGRWKFHTIVEAVCTWEASGLVGVLLTSGLFEVRVVGDGEFQKAQMPCMPSNDECVQNKTSKWRLGHHSQKSSVLGLRSPVMLAEDIVMVVGHPMMRFAERSEEERLSVFRLNKGEENAECIASYNVNGSVRAITRAMENNSVVLATSEGTVLKLFVDTEMGEVAETAKIAGVVSADIHEISEHKVAPGRHLTFTHDSSGVLQVFEINSENRLVISTECTSYCVHDGFLLFTTKSHLLYCMYVGSSKSKSYSADKEQVPSVLDAMHAKVEAVEGGPGGMRLVEGKGATRPIDRGSIIIGAIPGDVALVLQAPRGNLETVCPRPVVFEAIDKFARRADYFNAFKLCRRQRVDMNHIVDADYTLFLESIPRFVTEVDKASHLSIFMTFLSGDSMKTNSVCKAIVQFLKNVDGSERYLNALLTGLIRQEPSDIDGALEQVQKARDRSEDEAIAALDYLFVLMKNEEKVYEHALGRYNLQLALFVAKNSQMDPAEYSAELKNLSTMDQPVMKYSIDVRLERYEKALRHLYACGEERHEECMRLCHEHALYETALELFHDDLKRKRKLLDGFGSHLTYLKRYHEAGAMYIQIGEWRRASESYRNGGLWQLCASAIWRCKDISQEARRSMLDSLAEDLVDNGKLQEAAQVRFRHLGDVEGGIELLARAGEWDALFEAVGAHCARVATTMMNGESVSHTSLWEQVEGLVTEGAESILATIRENKEKLEQRRRRLEVVRTAKRELNERLANKGVGEENEADSDVFTATTASSVASGLSDITFTSRTSTTSVYSSASLQTGPLSAAKLEKQAERRRRKEAKKRVREGHPKEEEYLVGYLQKLVPNAFFRGRVSDVIKALMFVGRIEEVQKVVHKMGEFVEEAKKLPVDVVGEEGLTELDDRSWYSAATHISLM